jgi:type II secretory pathway pseudopilin PulG
MVIAIIGIISGIVLGVMPGVMQKKTIARVQTELTQLQAAIEYYKEKHGFYPPDSSNLVTRPPLFYELVGTRVEPRGPGGVNAIYHPLNNEGQISSADIPSAFPGVKGFFNSSEDASEVKNFYPTIRSSQYARDPDNTNAIVLVVPAKGPDGDFNPWRYVVAKPSGGANPINNPDSFDLWAEVVYGGRTNVIGNWKK